MMLLHCCLISCSQHRCSPATIGCRVGLPDQNVGDMQRKYSGSAAEVRRKCPSDLSVLMLSLCNSPFAQRTAAGASPFSAPSTLRHCPPVVAAATGIRPTLVLRRSHSVSHSERQPRAVATLSRFCVAAVHPSEWQVFRTQNYFPSFLRARPSRR